MKSIYDETSMKVRQIVIAGATEKITREEMVKQLYEIYYTHAEFGGWDGCITGTWEAIVEAWEHNFITDEEYEAIAYGLDE